MYYIFKLKDQQGNPTGYGFLTEENIKEHSKPYAIAILEELPEVPENLKDVPRRLEKDESGNFIWVETTLPEQLP